MKRIKTVLIAIVLLLSHSALQAARPTQLSEPETLITTQQMGPPILNLYPSSILYPTSVGHGLQLDTILEVLNSDTDTLHYSITIEEDIGPSGWLTVSGYSGVVPVLKRDSVTVHLNTGGIVNAPGTVVELAGRLILVSDAASSPDTLPIQVYVTTPLVPVTMDTLSTSCFSLVVKSDGNFGNENGNGTGQVNLDYYNQGGCDQLTNIKTYLYDASPVIGWVDGTDTVVSMSFFGGWPRYYCLAPRSSTAVIDSGDCEIYRTTYVTQEVRLIVEQTWYTPTSPDSCNFVIQKLQITSGDGQTQGGIVIGNVVDWDLPSDDVTTSWANGSGIDSSRELIYQFGSESHTGADCHLNDLRMGGIAFIESRNGADCSSGQIPYGAYTAPIEDLELWVGGVLPEPLLDKMVSWPGYHIYPPTLPIADLHSMMTFTTDAVIGADSVLTYYSVVATTRDGGLPGLQAAIDAGKQWYVNNIQPTGTNCPCCVVRGNVDNVVGPGGPIDVSDLTYLVAYLFKGGPEPPCWSQGNVDGIIGPGTTIDVSDLTYLVAYLFQDGVAPPGC